MDEDSPATPHFGDRLRATTIFLAFLRLGLTSFGGPLAHIGYFREEFVVRRAWLEEQRFADLIALCQMLPGPSSSQVGIGIGFGKAGVGGALAAWLGFTAPSAAVMVALGYGVLAFEDAIPAGLLIGLKAVVVAVVAQALWGMGRTLCPDALRLSLAVLAATLVIVAPGPAVQLSVIAGGACFGCAFLRGEPASAPLPARGTALTGLPLLSLALFFLLLALLPLLVSLWPSQSLVLADSFYRSGSLVFGGGHVVLPLLEAQVLPPGWVSRDAFLAGYGAAQALPGPLITFAAYLGTVMQVPPAGWAGGMICLVAIYLPSFLLVIGTLPLWERLRGHEPARRAMLGINAVVVGLLLAAFYDPVWSAGVRSGADFALAVAALVLLVSWKVSPWLVVVLGALAGWGLEAFLG